MVERSKQKDYIMDQSEHQNYTLLFAQSQEQLFVDFVRRSIDFEVKLKLLEEKIKNEKEISNNIVEQAAIAIQDLTNTNKDNENRIKALQEEIQNSLLARGNIEAEMKQLQLKFAEVEREYTRQKTEINYMQVENENLRLKLKEVGSKSINKKKVEKNSTNVTKSTDENEF